MTVNDAVLRIGDWSSNYSVGQANTDAKIRSVDHAVNYLKRLLGFPEDEVKTTFKYLANNFFYGTPDDFQDPIGLFYDSNYKNIPRYGPKWEYRPYVELMGATGIYQASTNKWSVTTVNGSTQLMLLGSNVNPGGTLDTLSSVNSWKTTGSVSGLAQDINNYPANFGLTGSSLKFVTGISGGTGGITNTHVNYSINNLVSADGHIEFYVMLSQTNISSVSVTLQTSTGNYYTLTQTTDYNGNPFVASQWMKLSFPASTAVITGSPSSLLITSATLSFAFTSDPATTIWVNDLYYVFPDVMDLYYYSTNKGTDVNGTPISTYTALTDNIPYADDFIELIALRAAYYIAPSLRADVNFMQVYKTEFTDFVKTWSRSHPKIRTRNDRTRTRLSR